MGTVKHQRIADGLDIGHTSGFKTAHRNFQRIFRRRHTCHREAVDHHFVAREHGFVAAVNHTSQQAYSGVVHRYTVRFKDIFRGDNFARAAHVKTMDVGSCRIRNGEITHSRQVSLKSSSIDQRKLNGWNIGPAFGDLDAVKRKRVVAYLHITDMFDRNAVDISLGRIHRRVQKRHGVALNACRTDGRSRAFLSVGNKHAPGPKTSLVVFTHARIRLSVGQNIGDLRHGVCHCHILHTQNIDIGYADKADGRHRLVTL